MMKSLFVTFTILIIYLNDSAEGCFGGNRPRPPPPTRPPPPSNCGRRNFNRIIAGTVARPNEFPWQALLLFRSGSSLRMFCGGSLISNQWVVTAAHCIFSGISTSNLYIDLGNHDVTTAGSPLQRLRSNQIVVHPSYNRPSRFNNDIALIRLSTFATLNNFVSPICMPSFSSRMSYYNNVGVISGWGRTIGSSSTSASRFLKYANTRILDFAGCTRFGFNNAVYTPEMVCADVTGSISTGGRTCRGDSGGPLAVLRNGRYELVGITSFGFSGCPSGRPSYFANVPALRSWIRSISGV